MSHNSNTGDAERASRIATAMNAELPGDEIHLARIYDAVKTARAGVRPRTLPIASPRTRFALLAVAATVAVVAVIVAPVVAPQSYDGDSRRFENTTPRTAPGVAYAQVTDAMEQVSTVRWARTVYLIEGGVEAKQSATEEWIRTGADPAYATRSLFKKGVERTGGPFDLLTDLRGKSFRDPKTRRVRFVPMEAPDKDTPESLREYVRERITEPVEGGTGPVKESPYRKENPWQMATEQRGGETVTVFRRTQERDFRITFAGMRRRPAKNQSPTPQEKQLAADLEWLRFRRITIYVGGKGFDFDGGNIPTQYTELTVTVDPRTHRMIREEIVTRLGDKTVSRSVRDDFRYNEEPPIGVFDWGKPTP